MPLTQWSTSRPGFTKSKSAHAVSNATAYIDQIGKTVDNWVGQPKSVLAVVEASTKMKNPTEFLGAAAKVAGAGKDATDRVTLRRSRRHRGKGCQANQTRPNRCP